MNIYVVSSILASLSSLFISVFFCLRDRKNPLFFAFSVLTFFAAIWTSFPFALSVTQNQETALFWARFIYIFAVFTPAAFLFFLSILLQDTAYRIEITVVRNALYCSVIFSFMAFHPSFIQTVKLNMPFYALGPGWSYSFFVCYFIWMCVYAFYKLFKNCISTVGQRHITLVYVTIANGLAFFGAGLHLAASYLSIEPIPHDFFVMALPILIAYGIVQHRLMDIQTVIHKTALWGALSSIIILPVGGIFYLGHHWIIGLSPPQMSLLVAAIVLVLIPYIKVVQPRIDHLFQRRKYDLQKILQDFNYEISELKGLDELVNKLQTTITSVLYPETISLVLFNRKEEKLKSLFVSNLPGSFSVERHYGFLNWIERENDIVELDLINDDPQYTEIRESAKSYFDDVHGKLVVSLTHDGKLLGLLNLDQKKNLKPYTEIELDFLFNLKVEASISLSNALLFDDVTKMSVELKQWATTLEHKVEERTEELKASHQKLEASYDKLQEYDRAKSRFFANVSHELRTPTTFILSPAEMLINRELGLVTSEQEKYIRVIHRNAARLLNLVNRLLELMKSEAGSVELICQKGNFAKFVEDVVHSVIPITEKKSLSIAFSSGSNIPDFFFDADKMEDVIYNLLGNAIKFTQKGGITVSCAVQHGSVLVKIADTGCGIPAGSLQRVFDRFYQVDTEASRVGKGTGIGLSLVKDFVELHEGRVWVESEVGQGTTVLFTIPMQTQERVERPRIRKEGENRREKERKRMLFADEFAMDSEIPKETPSRAEQGFERILIVDDMPDMLNFISDQLKMDYDCCFAKDGAEGINRARTESPDLIISDVMMPIKDGYQLCQELKSDPETASIPIILLTAKGSLTDKIEGLEEGADDYLTKPFNKEELQARVRTLIRTRKLQKDLQVANRQLSDANVEILRVGRDFAQSEKMAALGLLIAGVAHELNNPINFAKGSLSVVHKHFDRIQKGKAIPPAELAEIREDMIVSLDVVKGGLARAEAIVKVLSSFIRKDEEQFTNVDIHAGLDVTLELLRYDWRPGIKVQRAYSAEPIIIQGIPGQINQVFMNIFQNALHAMGSHGTIFVKTNLGKDEALIFIRDTGYGIPEENLSKVFEPFFTTKEVGKGTGLGLSLAYKMIVETHHGKIDVESEVGKGAEFMITLPLTQPKPQNPI